jgi:hypothetical protein
MDTVSHIIGVAKVEFNGELVTYEATPTGHRILILFSDLVTYNDYWKVADHVERCYNDDLVVEHFVPYADDHDPVQRTATRLYAQLQQM